MTLSRKPATSPTSTPKRAYIAPAIEQLPIAKTETGSLNPTEFLAIIGPTS